jgi:hypothetical protein
LERAFRVELTARRNNIKTWKDEQIRAANEARDAEIAAIDAATAAVIASLNARIAAFEGEAAAEDRALLERNVALAYDANERADAEKALRDFDRRATIDGLRAQIGAANESADAARDAADRRRKDREDEIAAEETRQTITTDLWQKGDEERYANSRDNARRFYEARTSDEALWQQARHIATQESENAIITLLKSYIPQYKIIGQSFGEAMASGFKGSADESFKGMAEFVPGTESATRAVAEAEAQVAGLIKMLQELRIAQQQGAQINDLTGLEDQLAYWRARLAFLGGSTSLPGAGPTPGGIGGTSGAAAGIRGGSVPQDEFDALLARVNAHKEAAEDVQRVETETAAKTAQAERETWERFHAWRATEEAAQSNARVEALQAEQVKLTGVLFAAQEPWSVAGSALGSSLVGGISRTVEPYIQSLMTRIANLLASVGGGGGGGGGESSAPSPPTPFARGLEVGMVREPMMAMLHPGEVVLNSEQQKQLLGGTRFDRGAFEGMFNGAHFNGSPEENARAIRAVFEDMMENQLGRGAFTYGIR